MIELKAEVVGLPKLARALREFASETGKDLANELVNAGRNVCVSLANQTAPPTQAIGEASIRRDVDRVYHTASETYLTLRAKDNRAAAAFWRHHANNKPQRAVEIVRGSGTEIAALPEGPLDASLHDGARDQRGRVPPSAPPRQLVRNATRLRAYQKKAVKESGKAASGWAWAAKALGKTTRGIPRWKGTGRHPERLGSALVRGRDGVNPSVILINSAPYIRRLCSDTAIRNAEQEAERKIRSSMAVLLQRRARKFNRAV